MANTEAEGVFENWEELEDSGELDKRLEKSVNKPEAKSDIPNGNAIQKVVVMREETTGTQYTSPAPQFKILKRNPKDANKDSLSGKGNSGPPKVPIKSLEQREAEYAEARLRIMGAAHPPESDNEESEGAVTCGTSKSVIERPAALPTVQVVRQPIGPSGGSTGFLKTDR